MSINPKVKILDEIFLQNLNKFNKAKILDQNIESPTDLNYEVADKIKLPTLKFSNHKKKPIRFLIINTGRTVVLSGKWNVNERPRLTGGPLNANYIFSIVVFHWGKKSKYGSFHTINMIRKALEIQAIYFKQNYKNLEEAAKFDDGIVIVSYIFEIRFQMNINLEPILIALDDIRKTNSSIYYVNVFELDKLIPAFENDYFTYNSKLKFQTGKYFKNVIWIIPRQLFHVSFYQIKRFSILLSKELLPVEKTFLYLPNSLLKPSLFLVNPSKGEIQKTCLPMPFYKDVVNINT